MSTVASDNTSFADRTPRRRLRLSVTSPRRRSRLSINSLLSSPTDIPTLCSSKHQHLGSEPSTSAEDPAQFSSLTEGSGSSDASLRRVYLSDQELCFQAKRTSAKIDFDSLANHELNNWTRKWKRKGFTLFTMDAEGDRKQPQVLATGDINCSIEEVIGVLSSTNDPDLNATMKGLYSKDFIYGSVVHKTDPEVWIPEGTFPPLISSFYVAVKTGMFVRSNMFARNEEWCYIESNERASSGNSFRMTQSTIDVSEIGAGKASHARVNQLRDITTAFLVEKIPQSRSVRLSFHGKYLSRVDGKKRTKGVVSFKATKARLTMLAKGVSRIPEIVRRRRLGFQKLANRSVFAAKNSRCTCCTKRLHVLTKKKRCYLCAYYVCNKCWSQEKMETFDGTITSISICTRCLECVDSCEYSEVSSQKRRHVRVEPDEHPSHSKSESPGKALVALLENALDDSDDAIKAAAKCVIEHIMDESKQSDDESHKSTNIYDPDDETLDRTSEPDPIKILEKCFELEPQPSLEECVLANAEWRNYPIHIPENPSTTAPNIPVPENEAQRLQAISESNFLNLGEVAELNLICSLASQELNCAISQVTIVDQDSELVLACNIKDLHRTRMARNQTFCSHLVMDDKPLMILNPEADVRFAHLDAVAKSGIRFYCGFPITAKDGTVVGSLCCLDFELRKVTRRQYSMMKKLARAASRVIQNKAVAIPPS